MLVLGLPQTTSGPALTTPGPNRLTLRLNPSTPQSLNNSASQRLNFFFSVLGSTASRRYRCMGLSTRGALATPLVTRVSRRSCQQPSCTTAYPRGSRSRVFHKLSTSALSADRHRDDGDALHVGTNHGPNGGVHPNTLGPKSFHSFGP